MLERTFLKTQKSKKNDEIKLKTMYACLEDFNIA